MYVYHSCPRSCFFVPTPRPPGSTPFPYTTLFRSHHLGAAALLDLRLRGQPGSRRARAWVVSSADRKSTRLNSSHVAISYAVFCLKNKVQTAINCTSDNTPIRL